MPIIGTSIDTTPATPPGGPVPTPAAGGRWRVTALPMSRPVTAAEVRRQCRLGNAADSGVTDDDLHVYIDAAVEYAESRIEAALVPRTIAETFYDGQPLDLSRGPVISILTLTGRPNVAVTDFTMRTVGNTTRVLPKAGVMYPITVTYRAGYATPEGNTTAIPSDLKLAILQLAATYFANRESVSDKAMVAVPHTVEAFFARKSRGSGAG